jgi:hypothetical protein
MLVMNDDDVCRPLTWYIITVLLLSAYLQECLTHHENFTYDLILDGNISMPYYLVSN